MLFVLFLTEYEVTIEQFFQAATYLQKVNNSSREVVEVEAIRADDFSNMLIGAGICQDPEPLKNLEYFFKLSEKVPEVLVMSRITEAIITISENEDVMQAVL